MAMPAVRPAAVAGMFYPDDARHLGSQVGEFLAAAGTAAAALAGAPKLLIVPHAGHEYSGAIAAQACSRLAPWHERITRVVLLGPAHRHPVRALAAPRADDFFDTPLGIDLSHYLSYAQAQAQAGDRRRVVGYAAIVFEAPAS